MRQIIGEIAALRLLIAIGRRVPTPPVSGYHGAPVMSTHCGLLPKARQQQGAGDTGVGTKELVRLSRAQLIIAPLFEQWVYGKETDGGRSPVSFAPIPRPRNCPMSLR